MLRFHCREKRKKNECFGKRKKSRFLDNMKHLFLENEHCSILSGSKGICRFSFQRKLGPWQWNSYRQVITIAKKTTANINLAIVIVEVLELSVSTILVISGFLIRSSVVRITFRALSHFPGPCRRYWIGVQGPQNNWNASLGSVKARDSRLGLTPSRSASSSMVLIQSP